MNKIAICVSTYKRKEGLEKLLISISQQKNIERYADSILVAVADNESPPTTKELTEEFSTKNKLNISWAHESHQGITYARNTSYRLAIEAGADICIFVDDDEELDTSCIFELLRVKEEFKADMVYGNSPPVFVNENTPVWIKKYFEIKEGIDGQELPHGATNCLLIDMQILKGIDEPFDNNFAHTGGEDTFLTWTLKNKGAKLVKSAKAKAYDLVPPERCSTRWILKRISRESAIFTNISILTGGGLLKSAFRILKLILKFIGGVISFIPFLLFTRKLKLKGLMLIWDFFGGIMGFFSFNIKEYKG